MYVTMGCCESFEKKDGPASKHVGNQSNIDADLIVNETDKTRRNEQQDTRNKEKLHNLNEKTTEEQIAIIINKNNTSSALETQDVNRSKKFDSEYNYLIKEIDSSHLFGAALIWFESDKNENNGVLSRKILSFFLINPSKWIKSSRDVLVNWDDITICVINVWFRNQLKFENNQINWLPNELIQMIIDCVIGLGKNRYTLKVRAVTSKL